MADQDDPAPTGRTWRPDAAWRLQRSDVRPGDFVYDWLVLAAPRVVRNEALKNPDTWIVSVRCRLCGTASDASFGNLARGSSRSCRPCGLVRQRRRRTPAVGETRNGLRVVKVLLEPTGNGKRTRTMLLMACPAGHERLAKVFQFQTGQAVCLKCRAVERIVLGRSKWRGICDGVWRRLPTGHGWPTSAAFIADVEADEASWPALEPLRPGWRRMVLALDPGKPLGPGNFRLAQVRSSPLQVSYKGACGSLREVASQLGLSKQAVHHALQRGLATRLNDAEERASRVGEDPDAAQPKEKRRC